MDRSSENEKREHPSVAALGADVTNSPMRSEGNTGGGIIKNLPRFCGLRCLQLPQACCFLQVVQSVPIVGRRFSW